MMNSVHSMPECAH